MSAPSPDHVRLAQTARPVSTEARLDYEAKAASAEAGDLRVYTDLVWTQDRRGGRDLDVLWGRPLP